MFSRAVLDSHAIAGRDARPAPDYLSKAPWLILVIAAAGSVWVQFGNSRLLGSWHGFLHSAVANRFSTLSFPPENPFFAGEALPYYWFYQFVGYGISTAFHIDLLHAFHVFSFLSLVAFIVFCGLIGRACFKSTASGAVIACLALFGANPLGPEIAAIKRLVRDVPLVERTATPVETTFVSDETADSLMVRPLLPAMYVGSDWHYGQNLVWFFDIGARAPALAMLMAVLYLILSSGNAGLGRYFCIAFVSALATAFSVVIGCAVAGVMCGASLALAAAARLSRTEPLPKTLDLAKATGACVAGSVLALPTYYHMFFRLSGGAGVSLKQGFWFFVAMIAADAVLLLPLAVAGVRANHGEMKIKTAVLTISALILLIFVTIVHLPEGNEHSLSNAAYCLLAIPAATLFAGSAKRRIWGWRIGPAIVLFLIFICLPVTACTLFAFGGRPPIPISSSETILIRTPVTGDLESFYEWIRRETSAQSIFITDPESPVKMSGNVSELPAFTGRTLFTDTANYLTTPNRDAAYRSQLAASAVAGVPLTAQQSAYLVRLARPVYIVSYREEAAAALANLYGKPVFHHGFVAAFRFEGGSNAL